jgi:6-phosphogluconolactonase
MSDSEKSLDSYGGNTPQPSPIIAGLIAAKSFLFQTSAVIGALAVVFTIFGRPLLVPKYLIPYAIAAIIGGVSYYCFRATKAYGSNRSAHRIRVSALVVGSVAVGAAVVFFAWSIDVGVVQPYIRHQQAIVGARVFDALAGKRFIYIANAKLPNQNSASIYAYQLEPDGELTKVSGSPFETARDIKAIAAMPQGTFLYTTDQNHPHGFGFISGYAINPTSGALVPVPQKPFPSRDGEPSDLAVDATGKYLYASNTYSNDKSGHGRSLSAYRIGKDGAIFPVSGEPFETGGQPEAVSIDPSGNLAYVDNSLDHNVSGYTVNPSSGKLSPMSKAPFHQGDNPDSSIAIDPDGQFIYFTNGMDNEVYAYQIEATSGTLKAVASFREHAQPSGAVVTPNGKFVYVANAGSRNVSAYKIDNKTGALKAIANSPFAADTSPLDVAVDPDGKYLFVVNSGSHTVFGYNINPTSGALTLSPSSPLPAGDDPDGIVVMRAPAPARGNVYISGGQDAVREILAVDGIIPTLPTIKTLGKPSEFAGATGIAVDGYGHVYVADHGNDAVKAVLAASAYVTTVRLGKESDFASPTGIAVDVMGNVYVTESTNGTIGAAVKEIVAVDGTIPASPKIKVIGSGYNNPKGIAVDRDGNVYVADNGNGVVKEIMAVGGSIPLKPTIKALGGFTFRWLKCHDCDSPNGPAGVAVDASGNVFVADTVHSKVREIVAVNGKVRTLGDDFSYPEGIALDSHGNVYVADNGNDSVKEIVAASGYKKVKILASQLKNLSGIAVR